MASKRKRPVDEDQSVQETDMMQIENEEPTSPRSKAQRVLNSQTIDSVSNTFNEPSDPIVDDLTLSVGAGWAFITSLDDSKQQAARGIATFIQKQCPLDAIQILAEHVRREEYLCMADDGYHLFENQTNRLRLLSKDFERAKQNMATIPHVFEGEGWRSLTASSQSQSELSLPSSPDVLSESDEIDIAHRLANPIDLAHQYSPISISTASSTPFTSNPSAIDSATWGPSGFPIFPSTAINTNVLNTGTQGTAAAQASGIPLHSEITASVVDMIKDGQDRSAIISDGGQHASGVSPANSLITDEGAEDMDMT